MPLDPNQTSARLRATPVRLTWRDLWVDYQNYRRNYFFQPLNLNQPLPKVPVDTKSFSLINYIRSAWVEKKPTGQRIFFSNNLRFTAGLIFFTIGQGLVRRYLGWDLQDPVEVAKQQERTGGAEDNIYAQGK